MQENAYILLHEKKINNLAELLPLLNKIVAGGRPLVIISGRCGSRSGSAALVVNKLRGVLNVCAVKAPGFGDRRKAIMGDLAVLTGGKFISEDLGLKLESVELSDMGSAKRVVINKDNTLIVEGAGSKKEITARAEQIRSQVEKTTSDYDKEKLQERLAKLTGGVAVVKAGANTETEMKERKDLIDDALHAVKASAEGGIVPGGGVAFLRQRQSKRWKTPSPKPAAMRNSASIFSSKAASFPLPPNRRQRRRGRRSGRRANPGKQEPQLRLQRRH